MVQPITRKNHFNPCFWTAYWNEAYFQKKLSGLECAGSARTQVVHVLNFRADRIYQQKVENIHYETDLCFAEITAEAGEDFCRRRFPEHLPSMGNDDSTVYLDFEDILSGIEVKHAYDALREAIQHQGIISRDHKAFLCGFLVIQALRGPGTMNSKIRFMKARQREKFEYFWMLKNALSDPDYLFQLVWPLTTGQWIFYRTENHNFPLTDSPILFRPTSVMATLSPRLLLEINLSIKQIPEEWKVKEEISNSKFREFRRRSIQNTLKEIIFHNPEKLKSWQQTPEYRKQRKLISTYEKEIEDRIANQASSVLHNWFLNPDDPRLRPFHQIMSRPQD